MRIMAVDVGEKRIGIAVSDGSGLIASPYGKIDRETQRKDLDLLARKVSELDVGKIVVGMPMGIDGEAGEAAQNVQQFVNALRAKVTVSVVTQDERFSTREAEKMLISADRSRAQRREVIDQVSAAILLQTYLDRQSLPQGQE